MENQPWIRFLAVCAGGAFGSGARYLVSGWALRLFGPMFPWGTLTVNTVGSFLLAFLMQASLDADLLSPTWRAAITVGVMGGFTTYSTFNYETLGYLRDRAWFLAGANLFATVTGCLVAGIAGIWLAKVIFR